MNFKDTYYKVSRDISNLLKGGETERFIIFPFGVNGVMTKDILKSQFGIEPAYIIDNELCKINDAIHPIEFLDGLNPDEYIVLLTIENPKVIESVRNAVYSHYRKDRVYELFYYTHHWDLRIPWLRRFAEFVYRNQTNGNVAECGVFQGEFAKYINEFFPDRKCYLFDSFEGFNSRDIDFEKTFNKHGAIDAFYISHTETSVKFVLSKMPYPENIVIKQGYIPSTFEDVNDTFCYVNLDMDIYKPMLEGIRFFYPRMVKGGILMLHDYYDDTLRGVERAVSDYEQETGIMLNKIPAECSSSLIIVR